MHGNIPCMVIYILYDGVFLNVSKYVYFAYYNRIIINCILNQAHPAWTLMQKPKCLKGPV